MEWDITVSDPEFQFQNGTIKRLSFTFAIVFYHRFNSKMVRLKAKKNPNLQFEGFCFNSKMVRLKVIETHKQCEQLLLFQFQNGTIKRYGRLAMNILLVCFNSKMVRLKV